MTQIVGNHNTEANFHRSVRHVETFVISIIFEDNQIVEWLSSLLVDLTIHLKNDLKSLSDINISPKPTNSVMEIVNFYDDPQCNEFMDCLLYHCS